MRPALLRERPLDRLAHAIAEEAESNATKNPSPVELTTSPPWSTNSARKVSSCHRRRCSQASSPMASARMVEATMSVKRKVFWCWSGRPRRSAAAWRRSAADGLLTDQPPCDGIRTGRPPARAGPRRPGRAPRAPRRGARGPWPPRTAPRPPARRPGAARVSVTAPSGSPSARRARPGPRPRWPGGPASRCLGERRQLVGCRPRRVGVAGAARDLDLGRQQPGPGPQVGGLLGDGRGDGLRRRPDVAFGQADQGHGRLRDRPSAWAWRSASCALSRSPSLNRISPRA